MLEHSKKRLARRRLLAWRALRRLARRQDGSAAVEFGLVGWPFFLLLFAIMETAMMFWAGQTLETAIADSGRLIMTGQAQQQKFNQTAFKAAVCDRLQGGLFDCNKVVIDVQTKPTFHQFDLTMPLDEKGNLKEDSAGYQAGGPDSIVLVRAFYQWPLFITVPGYNTRLLVASAAFRNEPYEAVAAPPAN
jgi:Flp pilus assembly protein TadG